MREERHELPASPRTPKDFDAFYDLAKLTGGGFTNLPPEKKTLVAKLERSAAGFERPGNTPGDDLYIFMLESRRRASSGTCQIFGAVGSNPFYSYHLEHADAEER